MTIAERVLTWFNSLNTILTQCNAKITAKSGTAATDYTGLPDAIDTVQSGYDTSSVTATAADVLVGKKFVDANGADVAGTMDNKGNVSLTLNDNIKNEVNSQKTLIQEITSIVENKASAYPTVSYDSATQTLTITEVS